MQAADIQEKILPLISSLLCGPVLHNEDDGMLSGYPGRALFYAYYHQLTGQKKHLQLLNKTVRNTLDIIGSRPMSSAHCSGLSGIAWGIRHLLNNDMIHQQGSSPIFEALDERLAMIMFMELTDERYDFMHQGLGMALYFIEGLPNEIFAGYLEEVVLLLEKTAIPQQHGISWKDNFTEHSDHYPGINVYNLGLAHGVPAILNILSLIYEKGIATQKAKALLEAGTNWLLSCKHSTASGSLSLYPYVVDGAQQAMGPLNTRLGWCYGDLGIAVTLSNLASRLKNDAYAREATEIFTHTLSYRNSVNGMIDDASLCHGAAGVSHIFRRAFIATREATFLEGSHLWMHQTLQMACPGKQLEGFKYLTNKGYVENYSLLDGLSGIGLAMIASICPTMIPAWDRCLLLS